ncbi:Hpt domain-containing protein [Simiduia agarivorans]|uniref:Multi-sensor hybrid histidine kinase n=1 Tax=Simiduia agarivorans (strain DSM 21679 / JCM 13881 / BCRC 17597 / SA1) TaxID=1117647 RepID=K4KLU0_SIMAS|nr:Hpt domain-containing protein [Simiduia agarivorans]AFU99165.1 multi-sensor hybrid histidine kinase [Simiduia agarivorans SA1 = DSM 21679]
MTSSSQPVDLATLQALFGDDHGLRLSILDEFCATTELYLSEFEAASTITAVGAVAHKLKSSARTVGANDLADICAGLEAAAKSGQQSVVDQLVPRLAPEIKKVSAFVASLPRT